MVQTDCVGKIITKKESLTTKKAIDHTVIAEY